jgi:pilus assembly protein CpaE
LSTKQRSIGRTLVVHPDVQTCDAVERALRNIADGSLMVQRIGSLTQAVERAQRFDARVVFVGLDESPDLALDVVRALRRAKRLIIGLYNPLVVAATESRLLRCAARAGVGDFIPLPVSESELCSALAASTGETNGARDAEGGTVSFFSNKGGAGTTMLAANTAVALAADLGGERVALCDADLQFGTVARLLGLDPRHDLSDLASELDHPGPLDAYLAREPETGLFVLAAPRDLVRAESVTAEALSRVVIALRRRFQQVVIDVPNRLDHMTLSILDLSDTVLVVTEPVAPTLLRTAQLLRLLEQQGFGPGRLKVVLNRQEHADTALSRRAADEHLGRSVDFEIPRERRPLDGQSRFAALVTDRPRSDFSQSVKRMARGLLPAAVPV